MERDAILRRLQEKQCELRARGVARAALFGSRARGDQQPQSDIDILVELASASRLDLFEYVGLVDYIKDLFAEPVDVANRAGLKPHVRPRIEREAIYAF